MCCTTFVALKRIINLSQKDKWKTFRKRVKVGNKILYSKAMQKIAETQANQGIQRFFCCSTVKNRNAGQKPGKGFHERIVVHYAVPLFTVQPVYRASVVFCQNDGIQICSHELSSDWLIFCHQPAPPNAPLTKVHDCYAKSSERIFAACHNFLFYNLRHRKNIYLICVWNEVDK